MYLPKNIKINPT